ncbi:MAG: AAA family ATPase, partial [Pseudomonadota bacterium]
NLPQACGRLTDGQGRTVDFKNCVVIMTSNLGSETIQATDNPEADYNQMKSRVMESVTQHFRPEFINRVDEIVVFHALSDAEVRAIADIQVNILRKRLEQQDIYLDVTKSALDLVGDAGFDPVYGARPLKRSIQQLIENPLSQKLLAGEFVAGDVIAVEAKAGELHFSKARAH